LAQERTEVEEAFAGDILGLWDAGVLRIGDTLSQDSPVEFDGIPRFSPEHFMRVRLTDTLKRKQLKKGLDQLLRGKARSRSSSIPRRSSAIHPRRVGRPAVRVVAHRLKTEYGVSVVFESLPTTMRGGSPPGFDPGAFEQKAYGRTKCLVDVEGRPLVLFGDQWRWPKPTDDHPELQFIAAVQPGRTSRA